MWRSRPSHGTIWKTHVCVAHWLWGESTSCQLCQQPMGQMFDFQFLSAFLPPLSTYSICSTQTRKEKWSLHCRAVIHCSKRNYFCFLRGTRENQWKCTHAKHTGNTVWKLKKSESVRIILLLFGHSVVSESLDPTDCSTPAFPGLHYLPEFA